MRKTPAYVTICLVFFILIGMGFAYSYFFYPNNHPVNCMIRSYTGKDCPSCGFSRSFSYYTHLQFREGKTYNTLSFPVFLFLFFQFILRGSVVFYFLTARKIISERLIKIEVIISILLFLLAFLPLILKF
jgi:hypothetical protein